MTIRLVNFISLKMGVSTVPWYCLNCTTYGYSWEKVETKSTLFLWANCSNCTQATHMETQSLHEI